MMPSYSAFSDAKLICLLREGDTAAFTELYNRYWALMYVYACKMLEDKDSAEDIVQEVFTYIWNNCFEIEINSSVPNYLYTAVRYRIFDYFDRQKVRAAYIESLQHFIEEGEYTTDRYVREKELKDLIEAAVEVLPPRMREVFKLSRKSFLSQKEIAERLNISDKTVKKQIGNAIKSLKLKLGTLLSLMLLLLP